MLAVNILQKCWDLFHKAMSLGAGQDTPVKVLCQYLDGTVDSHITHTPWWTHQAMGYEGVWGLRMVLKKGPKKSGKIGKNQKKISYVFLKHLGPFRVPSLE